MNNVPWWEGPLLGFDTETTGVDVERDRIVTVNLTWHTPGEPVLVHDLLLDPGIEIPDGATKVHGISTQYAQANGMSAIDGIREVLRLMRAYAHLPFVAYNGTFDFTILDREARRYGLEPFMPDVVIDPLVVDRHIDRYRRGPRKLIDAASVYGVVLDNAHSADADALAAVLVARAIGRTGKVSADLVELHAQQVGWRAAWAASLEEHLASIGKLTEPVGRQWPLIPFSSLVDA